nr:uncharacterized protein LOC127337051 isoform X3 [Lolium perenne]
MEGASASAAPFGGGRRAAEHGEARARAPEQATREYQWRMMLYSSCKDGTVLLGLSPAGRLHVLIEVDIPGCISQE